MPQSLASEVDQLYDEVVELLDPGTLSPRSALEHAEIRARIDDDDRRLDEARRAMTSTERREEASIELEHALCRSRAKRNQRAFEADLATRPAERNVAIALKRI